MAPPQSSRRQGGVGHVTTTATSSRAAKRTSVILVFLIALESQPALRAALRDGQPRAHDAPDTAVRAPQPRRATEHRERAHRPRSVRDFFDRRFTWRF